MGDIRKISDWDDETGSSIQDEEFFLKESAYPELYTKAREAYESSKRPWEPVEQLSPKGLALLSSWYAEKDGSEAQPIVASTSDDLEHILNLVAQSPVKTTLTVIVQMTDADTLGPYFGQFGSAHKTVLKLDKREEDVRVNSMDSTNNSTYAGICQTLLQEIYDEKEQPYVFYRQENEENLSKNKGDTFSRQMDVYQCGVFATKDTRELNRNERFLNDPLKIPSKAPYSENTYIYDLPATALKSLQHTNFSEHVLPEHGDEVVTRKGHTLLETHKKHHVSGYIQHFSQKYHDAVTGLLDTNKNSPEKIKAAVEKYDAASMTRERLEAVYGPKNELKISSAFKVKLAEMKGADTQALQKKQDKENPDLVDETSPSIKKN